ncbi:hypothetical protein J1605_008621 [Eschrichtius robustus]|uniref:Uncharacterized protein n=1 Tax=Eschrichtius robustus TaxID=9764 RepID=A0AB34GUG7_ESCRO|nr:hypothetical protein J1605_008621 [Eschrichtius robustus]
MRDWWMVVGAGWPGTRRRGRSARSREGAADAYAGGGLKGGGRSRPPSRRVSRLGSAAGSSSGDGGHGGRGGEALASLCPRRAPFGSECDPRSAGRPLDPRAEGPPRGRVSGSAGRAAGLTRHSVRAGRPLRSPSGQRRLRTPALPQRGPRVLTGVPAPDSSHGKRLSHSVHFRARLRTSGTRCARSSPGRERKCHPAERLGRLRKGRRFLETVLDGEPRFTPEAAGGMGVSGKGGAQNGGKGLGE